MANETEVTSDYPPVPVYLEAVARGDVAEPPPIPADGKYTVFGVPRKLVESTPSLEAQGLKTLFDPKKERRSEVIKLIGLSKEKFLDLATALGNDETDEALAAKVRELDLCLINLLYLTNELREEQAKIMFRDMLKQQTEAKKKATKLLQEAEESSRKRIRASFESLSSSGEVSMADVSGTLQSTIGEELNEAEDVTTRAKAILERELTKLKQNV